jgi:hypothetical protein
MPRPVTWRAQLWAAFDAFMNAASSQSIHLT